MQEDTAATTGKSKDEVLEKSNDEKETVTSLESLIIKDNNNSNQNNQESEIDKSLEKSILDEIIKN